MLRFQKSYNQKQPPRGVLNKSCSENMQQMKNRRTPMGVLTEEHPCRSVVSGIGVLL